MPAPHRPLVITADEDLLDDVLRLAAAADVEAEVAHEVTHARSSWMSAPLVVVGADLVSAVAQHRSPPRMRVVLVVRGSADHDLWRKAIAIGVQTVLILPDDERRLVAELADASEPVTHPAATVAVIGGRGGAGASVLAGALALTAVRQGLRALLIDADPLGGGIDMVLGQEAAQGARWPEFAQRQGRVSSDALREALPRVGTLTVLSRDREDTAPVPSQAMEAVLAAGVRGCDLVVVDLPRHVDDAATVALERADTTLLVIPAEVRATVAAARVLASIRPHAPDVRAVVRGPAPGRLDSRVVAETVGIPLAGWLAPEPGLATTLDNGDPPARHGRGPLARFCLEFLRSLGVPRGLAA